MLQLKNVHASGVVVPDAKLTIASGQQVGVAICTPQLHDCIAAGILVRVVPDEPVRRHRCMILAALRKRLVS